VFLVAHVHGHLHQCAVRFSLGYLLEEDEIDDAAERVATAVCRMRESGDRGWKAARLADAAPAGINAAITWRKRIPSPLREQGTASSDKFIHVQL